MRRKIELICSDLLSQLKLLFLFPFLLRGILPTRVVFLCIYVFMCVCTPVENIFPKLLAVQFTRTPNVLVLLTRPPCLVEVVVNSLFIMFKSFSSAYVRKQ